MTLRWLTAPVVPLCLLGCTGGDITPGSDGGAGGDQSAVVRDLAGAPTPDLSILPGADLAILPGADLAAGTADLAQAAPGAQLFPPGAPWNQDISHAALDGQSAQIIAGLSAAGGWGAGAMKIDFSITLQIGDAQTPFQSFTKTGDFYTPDCDFVPMPVPPGGALEGEQGYHCASDGDCHLIVVHPPTHKLYEMWRADIVGNVFNGGCLAVWDLTKVYPPSERGEQCTSADAGGFPIAAMLFTADEVKAGTIAHAIRFILPNSRIQKRVYVHPGTHSTNPTSGGPNLPPYGARLRLRGDYPLANLPNDGARTVARAMQTYGMFLADGGNIALTAADDRFSRAKWNGLLGSQDLTKLQVSDFEMVDGGARINYTGDCVRN